MRSRRPRAREFGLAPGTLQPGRWNAITDVPGVSVGHVTLFNGEGKLVPGKGPIRTGVTVILPHGQSVFRRKVAAATFVLNGFGKSVGLVQIQELGNIETPILMTNALNVGIVTDGLVGYMLERNPEIGVTTTTVNPVVTECNDGFLNDIRGRHVKTPHVIQAIENADGGEVEEGSVGAGTGMSAFELKGGIGTSSRVLSREQGGYAVGALVLSNFGMMQDLRVDGVPLGRHLSVDHAFSGVDGSIIMVIATDAPLSSRQLGRVAKRATHGLARTGSISGHGSGDIIISFSTTNLIPHFRDEEITRVGHVFEEDLTWIFRATADSVEEAILNSILKADTMVGRDGNTRQGFPLDKSREILRKYGKAI